MNRTAIIALLITTLTAPAVFAASGGSMPSQAPAANQKSPHDRAVDYYNNAERRLEAGGVLRHHERNLEFVEPLRRHRQADEAAPVLRHEVDRLWRDLVGSNRQVALVLPVFIVDDDDHLSLAEGVEGIFDPGDGAVLLAGPFGDLHMGLHGPAAWPTHRPAMTRYVSPVRRSALRTSPPCRTPG